MKAEDRYVITNIYGDRIDDDKTYTKKEAEAQAKKEWADGWEVYVTKVES